MALNSSGPISLAGTTAGQSIEVELNGNGTTQIALNDTNVRTLAGVPSGTIIMPTNFYGKSNALTINLTISSNTANYNLRSAAIAAGWNGTTVPVIINCTINSGVYVYATSTGSYAFDTGTGYPSSGVTLNLTNNGTILGMGGSGGGGGNGSFTQAPGTGIAGSVGGPALLLQKAISITNNGTISGGGGGGGGGGAGF
jgi:hypothetical protein